MASEPSGVAQSYKVDFIEPRQTYEWLLNKHYAKRIPSITYSFGLYDKDSYLVGVCTFGQGGNFNLNEVVEGCRTLELNRLVVDDGLPKNCLSYFVASCLKKLPDRPLIIISYADSGKNHHGYIYQATNWLYTGMGKGDIEYKKQGRQFHRKMLFDMLGTGSMEIATAHGFEAERVAAKHRYFFILANKGDRLRLYQKLVEKYPLQPYPKGDNDRYDASYKPASQGGLF